MFDITGSSGVADPHLLLLGGYCALSCGRCGPQGAALCWDQPPPGKAVAVADAVAGAPVATVAGAPVEAVAEAPVAAVAVAVAAV